MSDGNLRCPDVGYTRKERLPGGRPIKGFPDFAPDLAVEIISDSEERADVRRKVEEYFASGARQVWHVWPDERRVTVFTAPDEARAYEADDLLPGGDLLPGFQCRVADLLALE